MMGKYFGLLISFFICTTSFANSYSISTYKYENITADFSYSPTTIYVGTPVQFTDLSTINSGTIQDYQWSLDGGLSYLAGQNLSYTFSAPGNYIVLHRVYSSIGEMDSISKLITVISSSNLQANFSFSPDSIHVGESIQFINTSTMSSGNIVAYNWNFGDGMNVYLSNPVHVFSAYGMYTISLSVMNDFGETSIVTKAVIVYPPLGEQKVERCPAGDSTQLFCYYYGSNYQWQMSSDSGASYSNISDNANYSGTNLRWLQIKNLPSSFTGYKYRCIADTNIDVVYKISFGNHFVSTSNTAWEDPSNWSCGSLPDANTDVVVTSGSTLILNSNASCNSLTVLPGGNFTVNPGFTLTIAH